MKLTKTLSIVLLSVLFFACSPRVNYLGNYYSPTDRVDLYFSENDVKYEYEVMGIVKNNGEEFERSNAEAVQKAMVKKAKEVGADAILFLFSEQRVHRYNADILGRETSDVYHAQFLKYK